MIEAARMHELDSSGRVFSVRHDTYHYANLRRAGNLEPLSTREPWIRRRWCFIVEGRLGPCSVS